MYLKNKQQEDGINRIIFLILGALTLSGSGLYFNPRRAETGSTVLEHRMNRKSRKVAFFIPEKSELYGIGGQPDLPSLDVFFYSDAPAIHFYRNPQTRGAVKDFFVSLAGSEQVALSAMYYADKHNLPFTLVFSLMHTESRFLPDAVNQNATSIDRGVFQLNNLAFPHLNEHDFFDPDLNASYGVSHLEWCLSVSSSLDEALAIYNAGYGKVKRGDIPASTVRYIAKIHEYRRSLEEEFYRYLVAEIPHRVLNLAAVPAASHTP